MEPHAGIELAAIELEAFVFDLDGTLIDSIPGIASSLAAAFRSIGREMPVADLRRAIGPPIRIIAKRIEPSLTDDETLAIERYYRSLYDSSGWRDSLIFEGVAETLRKLYGAGFRLFVATNKPLLPSRNTLNHMGIANLFEAIVTRDSSTPHYASKAAMLGDLVAMHWLRPGATVMVGDTIEDREAAQANSVACIFAQYGYGEDPGAQQSIASFADLVRVAGVETFIEQGGRLQTR